jgi:hypothetical protein
VAFPRGWEKTARTGAAFQRSFQRLAQCSLFSSLLVDTVGRTAPSGWQSGVVEAPDRGARAAAVLWCSQGELTECPLPNAEAFRGTPSPVTSMTKIGHRRFITHRILQPPPDGEGGVRTSLSSTTKGHSISSVGPRSQRSSRDAWDWRLGAGGWTCTSCACNVRHLQRSSPWSACAAPQFACLSLNPTTAVGRSGVAQHPGCGVYD